MSVGFRRVQPIDSAFEQLPLMEEQVLTLQRPTLQLFPAVRKLIIESIDPISRDGPDMHICVIHYNWPKISELII